MLAATLEQQALFRQLLAQRFARMGLAHAISERL
jgi:hypothetical protein